MPQPIQTDNLSPFATTVFEALSLFRKPAELGRRSPLAAPSFTHAYLDAENPTDRERGNALRSLLRHSLGHFNGKHSEHYQSIIQKHYFEGYSVEQMKEAVGLSRSGFYKNRKKAVEAFSGALISQLHPAIQLEKPPIVRCALVDRAKPLAYVRASLAKEQIITITGSGGMGKTTLGSTIAQDWDVGPVFWFTVRPGLNDSLTGLLFSLGYFFHEQGESALWKELALDPDSVQPHQALETVRYCLSQLHDRNQEPLLCFDEVDLLKPTQKGGDGQVISLLRGMQGLAPMILIGQQALLDATPFCILKELSEEDTQQMLVKADAKLSPEQCSILYDYTHGNPRLVELFTILHNQKEDFEESLGDITASPPLEHLLSRICLRLSQDEKSILMGLSALRSPIPFNIWVESLERTAVDTLITRRLVHNDGQGNIFLLPAYRDVIYGCLPDSQRNVLHTWAATKRLALGMFTAGAYHLVQASMQEEAVWLWREHQQQEISQGQAAAALQIFQAVQMMPLTLTAKEATELLCLQLRRLLGDAPKAIDDIHFILATTPVLAVETDLIYGMIANDLGDFEKSASLHKRAIERAEALVEARLVYGHKGLGWRYMREVDLDIAWQEARLAEYEAQNFLGYVSELRGEYREAVSCYQAAITLCMELDYTEGLSKTSNNLSRLYSRLGQFSKAKMAQEQADQCAEMIGKIVDIISAKINWAFLYNLAGEYDNAVAHLQAALGDFKCFQIPLDTWQDTLIHQALAEAYLGQGELAKAMKCVQYAIAQEDIGILPDSYRTFGEVQLAQGKPEDALEPINRSITLTLDSGDKYLGGYAWRAMAQVQSALKNDKKYNDAIEHAMELFEQMNLANEVDKTKRLIEEISA